MAGPFYVDAAVGNDTNAGTSEGAGNAWQTIQHAADTVVAGEICYVKASATYTLAADIDFDTNTGSAASFIEFTGYTTTIVDGGKPVVDGDLSAPNPFDFTTVDFLRVKNFEIKNASNNGLYTRNDSRNHHFENIHSHHNALHGIFADGWYCTYVNCESNNNGWTGIQDTSGYSRIFGCYVHDNTREGIVTTNGTNVIGCIIEGNTWNGINNSAGSDWVIWGCTIDNNGYNGIRCDTSPSACVIADNLITNNDTGGYFGILNDAGNTEGNSYIDYNAFYLNDTPVSNITRGANTVDLTADPYVTVGSDFNLNTTAGGGDDCSNAGFPGVFPTITSTNGLTNIGACQEAKPVATSAPTFSGISGLERVAQGQLKASWSAATGTTTGYKVFVRKGSAPSFTDAYLWGIVDNARTSVIINTEADNDTMNYGDGALYVGVHAYNDGAAGGEDANTTVLNLTPDGGLMVNNQQIQVLRVD